MVLRIAIKIRKYEDKFKKMGIGFMATIFDKTEIKLYLVVSAIISEK